MSELPLLTLVIWLPILGGMFVLASGDQAIGISRWTALVFAVLTFLISLGLWVGFDLTTDQMQFVERVPWITALHSEYFLGIDGISLPLILLTTVMTILVIIAGWEVINYKPTQYFAALLIMEGIIIGVFSALDAMLFYIFWEAMLIPMFILIGIWGGVNRVYATIKFFLYTFFGSVFMLIGLIYLSLQINSLSLLDFQHVPLGMTAQSFLFAAFLIAFAVKVPMFPVHTWLPDAHVEAPTGGSVILAAVLLKIGGYGFLRLLLPIVPDASFYFDWIIVVLSLIAIVYIGFVALVQQDLKKLIAYSSITHMGFVTLGFFIFFTILQNPTFASYAKWGIEGGMIQMISHGFISGALFLCVGVLYDRVHSREIADYGGVINTMPWFGALFVFFAMANAALPGTSGFVGEFMVIIAAMRANFWWATLAATTLVLAAAFTLWMVKRVIFGEIRHEKIAALSDLNRREAINLSILAVAVLVLGIWPAPLINIMHKTIEHFAAHISVCKLPPAQVKDCMLARPESISVLAKNAQ